MIFFDDEKNLINWLEELPVNKLSQLSYPLRGLFLTYLFSKKIHWSVWPAVLVCIVGGFLLTELDNITVRLGDTLVLLGAFFWAFHIVFISK